MLHHLNRLIQMILNMQQIKMQKGIEIKKVQEILILKMVIKQR